MLARLVVDRSRTEAVTAIGAAWIAFLIALPVFEADARSPSGMAIGSLAAAGLIVVGFTAASRVRPMSRRAGSERLRLVVGSLALGALMAAVNFAFNVGMASLDPALHQLLAERLARLSPWKSALAAPVIEEVVFRLFCLSVIAVVLARFVKDRRTVFVAALAVSAFVFGVVHILRPEPESLDLVWVYRTGVTLKSTIGGVLLGWIYWRWGLGYSIACHGATNGVHALLEPLVFAS